MISVFLLFGALLLCVCILSLLFAIVVCLSYFHTCPHIDLMFLETSARTGENVEETFLKCARTILSKIDSGKRSVSKTFSIPAFPPLVPNTRLHTYHTILPHFVDHVLSLFYVLFLSSCRLHALIFFSFLQRPIGSREDWVWHSVWRRHTEETCCGCK